MGCKDVQTSMVYMCTIDRFFGKYRFLSNFWPKTINFRGIDFHTNEHAYVYAKSPAEYWTQTNLQALVNSTPGEAKKIGRQVPLIEHWERAKLNVMGQLIDLKFQVGDQLAEKLIETYPCMLVEGNTWGDTYWGVCNGIGKNILGQLLMNRRQVLMFT